MTVTPEPGTGAWALVVRADLTRAETNELFLSGDSMISWPEEDLVLDEGPRPQRSAMFVSEVAARPQGLRLRYREETQARRAAALLRMQFEHIGIREDS